MTEDLQSAFDQLRKAQEDDTDVNQYIDEVDQFLVKLETQRNDGQTVYLANLRNTFQKKAQLLKTLDQFVNESAIEAYLIDNVDALFDALHADESAPDQYYKLILNSTGEILPLADLSRFDEEEVIKVNRVEQSDKQLALKFAEDMMKHGFEYLAN